MRVLWSVNTIPPVIAESLGIKSAHAISWVDAMKESIKNKCELAIVVPGTSNASKSAVIDGIKYYVLSSESNNNWSIILEDYKPDIIHVYGTEKTHNVHLIDKEHNNVPIMISLQGIISEYVRYYLGGIESKDIIRNYTLKDIVFNSGVFSGRRKFTKQAYYEKKMLTECMYVEGRSDWDRAITKVINPQLKYYYCPRMIRKDFFDVSWNLATCEKHTIFAHQGDYPIKGIHFLLDALSIVVKKYPDTKLYIAGKNVYERVGIKKKLSTPGYIKLINNKIRDLGLKDNIIFTGYLDANNLARLLAKMHICVTPSAIENAPNAIAEAMIVGTPCIASFVGGNASMLDYGKCGRLYTFDEPQMLAYYIEEYFENDRLCEQFSMASRKIALKRHDPFELTEKLLGIYANVIDDFSARKGENV